MSISKRLISVSKQYIVEKRLFKKKAVHWADVKRIGVQEVNRVTYDETVISIESYSGESIFVGELDASFQNLMVILKERYPEAYEKWCFYKELPYSPNRQETLFIKG